MNCDIIVFSMRQLFYMDYYAEKLHKRYHLNFYDELPYQIHEISGKMFRNLHDIIVVHYEWNV